MICKQKMDMLRYSSRKGFVGIFASGRMICGGMQAGKELAVICKRKKGFALICKRERDLQ